MKSPADDEVSAETIDFGGALLLMRAGIPVRRLAWDRKRPMYSRKYKIHISASGKSLVTTFLNYQSDTARLSSEDLLAKDWIEVEQ